MAVVIITSHNFEEATALIEKIGADFLTGTIYTSLTHPCYNFFPEKEIYA